jgi:mono/diheme cytochrome c family protein
MSVLALLPLWAVLYAGTLSKASTGQPTQLEAGATIFAANCATCHGATGGGGVGPALAGGAVLKTFPNRADHLRWVWGGSSGWPSGTYGAQNKPVGAGGMPNFNETLTPEELLSVVRYEREGLSGEQIDPKLAQLDPTGRLMILDNGTPVDAVTYYFGDTALGATGTYTVKGKDPFVNGAKYSAAK